MKDYLDDYAVKLLHLNDVKHNKLIDLTAADPANTYYLSRSGNDNFSEYMLLTISQRIGQIAQTALANSSLSSVESMIGRNLSHLEWKNGDGNQNASQLNTFICDTYKDISFKGINPLFLSIGAIKWRLQVSQKEYKEVLSPLLIFPIKLIRSVNTTPVSIEFVDDDIFFNPCLYKKMERILLGDTAAGFPHPNGIGSRVDDPIDLKKLGDGNAYFEAVEKYVRSCRGDEDSSASFEFIKDIVAIAQYNHSDLCMYYDFRRNREKIEASPLIQAVFTPSKSVEMKKSTDVASPYFVLQHDSVQKNMITRVVNGESLVIKGPPGTGKTATIANMISSLMAEQKRVLLVSSKVPALEEVYHKLPDNLRKFALLLDYENEAQAANINPSVIKADLSAVIEAAKICDIPDSEYERRNHANSEKNAALSSILSYYKMMYHSEPYSVLGDTYYNALDRYCKSPELKVIQFARPQDVLCLSRAQYRTLLSCVRDAGVEFEKLTENGTVSIFRNPWYGVTDDVDINQVYHDYAEIEKQIGTILKIIAVKAPKCVELQDLCLSDIVWAVESNAEIVNPEILFASNVAEQDYCSLCEALMEYLNVCSNAPDKIAELDIQKLVDQYSQIDSLELDEKLCVSDVKTIYQGKDSLYDVRGVVLNRDAIDTLIGLAEEIERNLKEGEHHLEKTFEVFRKTEKEEELNQLWTAYQVLKQYQGSNETKPRPLDFKARSLLKALINMCYLKDTAFTDIVSAVCEFQQANEHGEIANVAIRQMAHIYKKELDSDAIRNILSMLHYAKNIAGNDMIGFVNSICSVYSLVTSFADEMECGDGVTLQQLKQMFDSLCKYRGLQGQVDMFMCRIDRPFTTERNAEKTAKAICAWHGVAFIEEMKYKTVKDIRRIMHDLYGLSTDDIKQIRDLQKSFRQLGNKYFTNYYSQYSDQLTLHDLMVFCSKCSDRTLVNSALAYNRVLQANAKVIALDRFFRPFEFREIELTGNYTFEDYFEHSVYGIAVKGYAQLMLPNRNALGRDLAFNFKKCRASEQSIQDANRKLIEKKLLLNIRADDKDFRFLSDERGGNASVRKLFREHSAAILKLKKCMILSPSTVSVLFQHSDYWNFDIVIIDEASQMESVTLLPVLARSKQCVVVGDEWQMPPIKHFEAKIDEIPISDDEEAPEASALSLVLRNAPFDATYLVCHYRSRTESLIKFSQESFYPNMRTFPSPVPQKERLGLKDLYIEGGVCVNGVNEAEAKQVVECIREHFLKFYDDTQRCLTRSFGVVTFGVAQLNRIKSILRKDEMFKNRWNHQAERLGVDDKFFYCTVETVQGQQAADLFLSMTYTGHSALGGNELGNQVFNVAVSRATDSITVIHSVKAADAKPDYVKRYLEIVEYFNSNNHSPFVSQEPERGFIKNVRDCILRDFRLPPDRVICHYGATSGSIRIPIAILSPDKQAAQLGIFCEIPTGKNYDYMDYHAEYYEILESMRQWHLHRICIHDWVDNFKAEKQALGEMIERYVVV